jgi:hypothetical protein
VGISLLLGKGI